MRNINPGIEVQGQYSGGATQELFTIGELDQASGSSATSTRWTSRACTSARRPT